MIGPMNDNDYNNTSTSSSSKRAAESLPQQLPLESVHQLSGIISPLEAATFTSNNIEKTNLLRQILVPAASYVALSNSVALRHSHALLLQQHQQSGSTGTRTSPASASVVVNSSANYLNHDNIQRQLVANEMAKLICKKSNDVAKLTSNLASFRTTNGGLLQQGGNARMLQQQRHQQNHAGELSSPTIILIPGESDILLGRGGLANQHPGNVFYRALLDQQRAAYMDAPKYTKKQISRTIVVSLLQQGGRFLERMPKSGGWYQVSFDKAVNKTSQGLRGKISRKLLNEAKENQGGSLGEDEQCTTTTSTKE